jgi:hypothetical protein
VSKRDEIAPNSDKRYVRRGDPAQFTTEVDEGRSLSSAPHHKANHDLEPGRGGRGDQSDHRTSK